MTTAEIDRVTTPETETTKTTKETNLKPAAAEDGKGIGASVGIDVESEEEGGDEEDAESDEEESDSDDDEEDDDEDDDLLLDLEDWPLLDRGNAYMM